MNSNNADYKPLARTEGLVIQELPDEVLIYDLERDKAHCLNPTAALVWKNCDGKTSVSNIAIKLSTETNLPTDERIVLLALNQLSKVRLLAGEISGSKNNTINRREMIKRVGFHLAIGLPLITSILAPTVQAANTCACVTTSDCTLGTDCLPTCDLDPIIGGTLGICVSPP